MDDGNGVIYVSAAEWDRLQEELARPPRVLPKLLALLTEDAPWETHEEG